MNTSTLGLEGLGELMELLETPQAPGAPRDMALSLIDEDPAQPRTEFDSKTLEELAETIRVRGIKTPISVRPNLEIPGRYVINHGARRYRASKLAGKASIPVFIDEDYSAEDQIIENLQRDALSAREIAAFIGRLLAQGRKKGEIARAIGKSPAYVTQHVALLDMPDALAELFHSGRCADVTVMNELVAVHRQHPTAVEAWLPHTSALTRGAVKSFREKLEKPRECPKKTRLAVLVRHEGHLAEVLMQRPENKDCLWIRTVDGKKKQVPLSGLQLAGIDTV